MKYEEKSKTGQGARGMGIPKGAKIGENQKKSYLPVGISVYASLYMWVIKMWLDSPKKKKKKKKKDSGSHLNFPVVCRNDIPDGAVVPVT